MILVQAYPGGSKEARHAARSSECIVYYYYKAVGWILATPWAGTLDASRSKLDQGEAEQERGPIGLSSSTSLTSPS